MKKGKQDGDSKHYYGFDSTGLEKAAAAAKYLDNSQNAKEAFDLALKKEATRQLELEESKVQLQIQATQVQEEERRRTVEYETQMAQRRAEYQVQLELQRDQQKMQHKEQMAQEARARDEESVQRQEQMRRDTLEYEYQLKASIKAQALEQQKAGIEDQIDRGKEYVMEVLDKAEKDRRESTRQNLMVSFNMLSNSLSQGLSNPQTLKRVVLMSLGIFGAFHFSKVFITTATARVLGRFGKPVLVRETSKIHTSNPFLIPFIYGRKFYTNNIMRQSQDNLLKGVILDKELEDQLREISYAVLNRRKHYAPAKNLLFYGPPGTGKTLFAKKLAMESGLEYAVMVGSDIAPLGPNAVTELNKLVDWAEGQSNGMILFIDEADAFLRNRNDNEMSEHMRHTVNTFLYRTGTPSEKVVVVLATNNPNHLDGAVHDRIDEVVGFNLPNENERKLMLFHYLVKYCQPPQTTKEKLDFLWKYPRSIYRGKKLIRMEDISKETIEDIAKQSEGFSGREVTKMVIAWHDAAFTLPDPVLTSDLMYKVLKKFRLQHELKHTWTQEESMIYEKLLYRDEDELTGSRSGGQQPKQGEEALQKQEHLMNQINRERLDLKEQRERQAEELAQSDPSIIKTTENVAQQNKQH